MVTPFPRKPRVNNFLQQQQGLGLYTGNSYCLLQPEKLAKPEYVKNGADIAENQCWLGGTGSKRPALEVKPLTCLHPLKQKTEQGVFVNERTARTGLPGAEVAS